MRVARSGAQIMSSFEPDVVLQRLVSCRRIWQATVNITRETFQLPRADVMQRDGMAARKNSSVFHFLPQQQTHDTNRDGFLA
jgi:hypothetical protein